MSLALFAFQERGMIDLEADDAPGVVAEPPVSETPPSSEPAPSPASDDSDPYAFDDPGALPLPEVKPTEPAPVVAAEPAPVVEPVVPTLSPALAQRAANIGFTPESLTAFKDPMALEIAVRQAEQVATNVAIAVQQNMQRQFAQPAPVQQTQQLPPAPVAPPPFDEAGLRAQMAAQGYDETLQTHLVANAKGLHAQAVQNHEMATRIWQQDKFNAESVAYMQRKDQEVAQIRAEHQQELVNRDFADFHKGLPEQHQKLVSEQSNKAQIYGMAVAIANGMASQGQQLPSNVEIFRMATNAVLGDKLYGAAVDKVRQEVATHQNRSVARPSAGHATTQRPRTTEDRLDAAARFAEDFERKLGITSAPIGRDSPEV